MRILTVDDSRAMRRIIRGAAEVLGFEFLEASNGLEALAVLDREAGNVDLITLDVNMPEMNGLECLRAIKKDPRYAKIPVVMVTAELEKGIVGEAIRLGACHYITKPFSPQEITARLMEAVGMGMDF